MKSGIPAWITHTRKWWQFWLPKEWVTMDVLPFEPDITPAGMWWDGTKWEPDDGAPAVRAGG